MENEPEIKISSANGYVIAAGLTFIVFWKLNILKEAYPSVKSFLEFYKPVGPLLGLFASSLVAFIVFSLIFQLVKVKNQTIAVWFFILSALLFALMVFPPVFEPVVEALSGK